MLLTGDGLNALFGEPAPDPEPTDVVVVFRSVRSDVPFSVRLKGALKRALRDHGLRAVHLGSRLPAADLASNQELLDQVAELTDRVKVLTARPARQPRRGTIDTADGPEVVGAGNVA